MRMAGDDSFPALELLKQEHANESTMYRIVPDSWLVVAGPVIDYMFGVEYAERRDEVLAKRDEERKTFTLSKNNVEKSFASDVNKCMNRIDDGELPSQNMDRVVKDLEYGIEMVEQIEQDRDQDYLTVSEKRKLDSIKHDLIVSLEYAQNKRLFDEKRNQIERKISAFNTRYEPYKQMSTYMISADETVLISMAEDIGDDLHTMLRELQLELIPDADRDWFDDVKHRFDRLVDVLPQYNELFIDDVKTEFSDVLRTKHGKLNPEQTRAVIVDDENNLIDASAGTGKTLTLKHRFMYLYKRGVLPERIVAITFMNDAADEMTERILSEINVDESRLHISTIHSFAGNIVDEAREYDGYDKELGEDKERVVEEYVEGVLNNASPTEFEYPTLFKKFKHYYTQFCTFYDKKQEQAQHAQEQSGTGSTQTSTGLGMNHGLLNEDRDEWAKEKLEAFIEQSRVFKKPVSEMESGVENAESLVKSFVLAALALVEVYTEIRTSTTAPVDFADMIEKATSIIESNPDEYARRFEHILVDEYQDLSPITIEFVNTLAGVSDDTHLFCVGDDWQSIMGFTGADVTNFTEFKETHSNVSETTLKRNYRCPPDVVNAGKRVIEKSSVNQNEKEVVADSDPVPDSLQVHQLGSNAYDERCVEHAVQLIRESLEDGYGYDDIMVISSNDGASPYMNGLRESLREQNISHTGGKDGEDFVSDVHREQYDVRFEGGDAVIAESGESVPMVTVQSIHRSKGTESEIVILLNAVEYTQHGIPRTTHTDKFVAPAMEMQAEHVPEERRLFYVALTRAENTFYAIAEKGEESRFITDVSESFTFVSVDERNLTGVCTSVELPDEDAGGNLPCEIGFEVSDGSSKTLVGWGDPPMEEGEEYVISDVEYESFNGEVRIRFDKSEITSKGVL